MSDRLSRAYTWVASIGLALQGTSTLLARLVPEFDQAVPALLEQTKMIPSHSLLHMASSAAGFWVLSRGGRAPWLFALGFGLFYTSLSVAGGLSDHGFGLGLQPFDHPFHAVLGAAGVLCAAIDTLTLRRRKGNTP